MFLEALGLRRVTRVPPGGALFIEFVKIKEELYVRLYLYNDIDLHKAEKITLLKFPLDYSDSPKQELLHSAKLVKYI